MLITTSTVTTTTACLGNSIKSRTNIHSLLLPMLSPEMHLCFQDSELSSQLSRGRLLKNPFIINTAALILSQKGGTQPVPHKGKENCCSKQPPSTTAAGGITSERFLRYVKTLAVFSLEMC